MRLRNFLIVVSDIEKSKRFYRDLFDLQVVSDFGENVVLSEGLVLQERKLWSEFIARDVTFGGNNAELYFEETNLDFFIERLRNSKWNVEFVNERMKHSWGQEVIRFYDPDGHIVEVGQPFVSSENEEE